MMLDFTSKLNITSHAFDWMMHRISPYCNRCLRENWKFRSRCFAYITSPPLTLYESRAPNRPIWLFAFEQPITTTRCQFESCVCFGNCLKKYSAMRINLNGTVYLYPLCIFSAHHPFCLISKCICASKSRQLFESFELLMKFWWNWKWWNEMHSQKRVKVFGSHSQFGPFFVVLE